MRKLLTLTTTLAICLISGAGTAAADDVPLNPVSPWDPRPDLVITGVSSSSFVVANVGDKWSAGSFFVHVRGKSPWASTYLEADYFVRGLAAGQSATFVMPPMCDVAVLADSTGLVAEQNELNNLRRRSC